MTILVNIDWANGTLDQTANTYTAATPDVPNGQVIAGTQDSTIDVFASAPWNGQSLFNCTHWYDGSSTTSFSALSGARRFLVQVDPTNIPTGSATRPLFVVKNAASQFDYRVDVLRLLADTFLRVRCNLNSGSGIEHYVDFGTWPSAPFNLEFYVDPNNATESQRLRARYWDVGASPGAFVNRTSGSGTYQGNFAAEPDQLNLADPGNNDVYAAFGKIIISDSISEDLSALLSSQSIIPKLNTYRRRWH